MGIYNLYSLKKWIGIILITGIFVLPQQGQAFERYKRVVKFDKYFSKYSKRFFGPTFDWHYFKAQAVAESRLNPKAESGVGAAGIMQIMPRTFKEISKKIRVLRVPGCSRAGILPPASIMIGCCGKPGAQIVLLRIG